MRRAYVFAYAWHAIASVLVLVCNSTHSDLLILFQIDIIYPINILHAMYCIYEYILPRKRHPRVHVAKVPGKPRLTKY